MAQRKPESAKLSEVLKLVTQLSPEDQKLLEQEFSKLRELRRRCAESEASLDRGEGIPAEKVFAEFEADYENKQAND